jgi:queuine tRNA-ribosyltransferase
VIDSLATPAGPLRLPAFLPDATRGTLRTVPTHLVAGVGIEALMANAWHLAERPGADAIRAVGGLHAFVGFPGPIATDSGGYQVWSLLRERPDRGAVARDGFTWRTESGEKRLLTPEKAIRAQVKMGADLVFCLDQCTHPDDPASVQEESVDRTVAWARVCRKEFDRATAHLDTKPLLYGVVQGGRSPELRKRCADELCAIGFDGYGFGGVPVETDGQRVVEEVALVSALLPKEAPKHALGLGRPDSLLAAWRAGYTTFDATAPTREARRGLLYLSRAPLDDPDAVLGADRLGAWFDATDAKSWRDPRPVDETCDCPLCTRYPRATLAHLFRVEDPAGAALASLHNLRFLTRLIATLRTRTAGHSA